MDITRKHERLLEIRPAPAMLIMSDNTPYTREEWRHLDGKTIMLRYPAGTELDLTHENFQVLLEVLIHEPSIELNYRPAVSAFALLAGIVSGTIKRFDR
jgi:hypothetical protein